MILVHANVQSSTILLQKTTEYPQKFILISDKTTITIDKLCFNHDKHR